MENKSSKIANIITSAVFIVFVMGFALALIIKGDREFSEMENRTLAQKPEVSWKNIKEGTFSTDLESYISDQLFAKDELVTLKTDLDFMLGKSYQNGVYLIEDSGLRYVQKYEENRTQIAENVGCLNDFAKSLSVPADLILVPNVSAFTLDKLPAGAVCDDQKQSIDYVGSILSERISFYPMTEALSESYGNWYYRTDHHWTAFGARRAMERYLLSSGQIQSTDEMPGIEYVRAGEDFYGTLYSKAPVSQAVSDTFYYGDNVGVQEIEWVNEGKISDSILDRSFLDKKDKYASFFGGNFAQIRIKTGHEGGRALVLKDSYANSAVQQLFTRYSEIVMVDLRYYHMQEKDVSELVSDYGIDRVIMLYNMDFLNEDRNFVWLS